MVGVACIIVSGAVMAFLYVGSLDGFYGTAYGVMVATKIAMLLGLLALGGMNYLLVERLRLDPDVPVTRLKRFAEVEMGVGFALFFAAASVTSSPPSVDLPNDRVSWAEVVDRNTPQWPRLSSPSHADLALPALQLQLDAEAAAEAKKPPPAFVPGSGDLPPRNAEDIAWSEYNHHWAGLFVVAIAVLGTAQPGRTALGAALAGDLLRPRQSSCSCAPIRRSGRWARKGSSIPSATSRWCSTASSCC